MELIQTASIQPNVFDVVLGELGVACGTLPTSIRDPFFHALLAVHVSATHDNAFLVSIVADRTGKASLQN
jgi:hypothetical protein